MRVLDGKVALVTGAASGLGRGSAIALARHGASVVLADVDLNGVNQTRDMILASEGRSVASVGDVSDPADVQEMIEVACHHFGGLDVVHANAGVERYVELEHMSDEDLDLLVNVDLKGVLYCFRAAIPELRRRGGGVLIATSSVQATHSLPGCVVYAAAKAGVIAASRTLALELGGDGIRVLTVSPGTIDTPMLTRDLADMNTADAEGFLDRVRAANTLGRIGTSDEVGEVIAFLASDAAAYITATDIVVDGGFTAVKAF